MPSYYLKQMTCLYIPRVDLVRVKRPCKNHLSSVVKLETDKLTALVRPENSKLFLFQDIIGIEGSIKTAGEKSVDVGKFKTSNCSQVLIHASHTEKAGGIPEANSSLMSASCV